MYIIGWYGPRPPEDGGGARSLWRVVMHPVIFQIGGFALRGYGLMAMLGLSAGGWIALCLMPIAIIIFAIIVTKKTPLKILSDDK